MKIQSIVSLIVLLSLSNALYAQKKVELQYGPVQKFKFSESFLNMDILDADAGGYYALQVPYSVLYGTVLGGIRNYHLAKYDATDLTKGASFSMDVVEEKEEKTFINSCYARRVYKEEYKD